MSLNFFKDFMLQLAFITTLIFAYQIFYADRSKRGRDKLVLSILFGLSILLCMTFPAVYATDYRVDIRAIPLLLGTLYGGPMTGFILCAIIVLYRSYIGLDLGLATTVLTLLISMPVFLYFQKSFAKAGKNQRIRIALPLLIVYSMAGIASVTLVRGLSLLQVLEIHYIHILFNVAALLFFIALNEAIREMIRQNLKLESEAKDAEIAFLRSQINPHFLYNTLSSIAALCIDEPRKAQDLTLNLSQYLRSSFQFKQLHSLTTIEKELELVEAYLHIEKARFGARLCVEYDVDADLDIMIPPLLLQPLVENAVKHGLMTGWKVGTVKISVKQEDAAIVRVTVEDDGCGMSEEKRTEILQAGADTKGVGLWNISRRYQMLYGRTIRLESAEGRGTKVSFDIPVQRDGKERG